MEVQNEENDCRYDVNTGEYVNVRSDSDVIRGLAVLLSKKKIRTGDALGAFRNSTIRVIQKMMGSSGRPLKSRG